MLTPSSILNSYEIERHAHTLLMHKNMTRSKSSADDISYQLSPTEGELRTARVVLFARPPFSDNRHVPLPPSSPPLISYGSPDLGVEMYSYYPHYRYSRAPNIYLWTILSEQSAENELHRNSSDSRVRQMAAVYVVRKKKATMKSTILIHSNSLLSESTLVTSPS